MPREKPGEKTRDEVLDFYPLAGTFQAMPLLALARAIAEARL